MRLRLRRLGGSTVELGISGSFFTEPDQDDPDIVDCSAFIALPGLVDAHAHLQANGVDEIVAAGSPDLGTMATNARSQIEAGVLLIADKGSKSNAALAFLATDPSERPELEMAGEILVVEHGYYPGFGRVIDPSQAGEAAAEAAVTAATWVKFIGDWPRGGVGPVSNFDEHQLAAAVAAAHRAQARVAVHTMAPGTATAAVRAGVDSIEHGLFLTGDDVEALGRRGGAWVPTVFAMEAAAESLRPGSSGRRLLRDGLDNVRELLPGAVGAGVRVLAGTDLALAHGEVAREVEKLAEYGMSPHDIVASTVFGGYEYLGASSRLEAGGRADVVCVSADPRDDVSALANPCFVMRLGRVVRPLGGPN
jgi:imidazolonepropionase-like amidohydrolase